jgi:hypothetical protein
MQEKASEFGNEHNGVVQARVLTEGSLSSGAPFDSYSSSLALTNARTTGVTGKYGLESCEARYWRCVSLGGIGLLADLPG